MDQRRGDATYGTLDAARGRIQVASHSRDPDAQALDADRIRTKACDDMLALFAAADAEKKAIERKRTAPIQVARFEA